MSNIFVTVRTNHILTLLLTASEITVESFKFPPSLLLIFFIITKKAKREFNSHLIVNF